MVLLLLLLLLVVVVVVVVVDLACRSWCGCGLPLLFSCAVSVEETAAWRSGRVLAGNQSHSGRGEALLSRFGRQKSESGSAGPRLRGLADIDSGTFRFFFLRFSFSFFFFFPLVPERTRGEQSRGTGCMSRGRTARGDHVDLHWVVGCRVAVHVTTLDSVLGGQSRTLQVL